MTDIIIKTKVNQNSKLRIKPIIKIYKKRISTKHVGYWRELSNGFKHGKVRKYFRVGNIESSIKKKGTYVNGKRDGDWEEYYQKDPILDLSINKFIHGQLYRMYSYVNGKLHGKYEQYNIIGTIRVSGYYINGKKNGMWLEYLPDKLTIEYKYDNDQITMTKKYKNDICVYHTYMQNETLWYQRGFAITNNKQVKIHEGNIISGLKHGYWCEWFPSGKIKCEGHYINGYNDGLWKYYFQNGSLRCQGYYVIKNNLCKKSGEWEYYHNNGSIHDVRTYD